MDCNIVRDLIPLYIDGCCSEESRKLVEDHIEICPACRELLEEMKAPSEIASTSEAPVTMSRLNDWRASVLQSILLFLSFAVITVGVALEARTPAGPMDGFWAGSLIVPATGFLLSLANWYFIRFYRSKRSFSNCSALATLSMTACGYIWAGFHYEGSLLHAAGGLGIVVTIVLCIVSLLLSNRYAKMLGKE